MFAIKRNNTFVHHVVFESSNDNYPDHKIVMLTFDSAEKAYKYNDIWPGIEVVELKKDLL